jgi:hypothetical protein
MEVYVPAIKADCPAAQALSVEGVDFHLAILWDDLAYGTLLSYLWQVGESFAVLEHDVVPFPGAMEGLENCEEDWCVHKYPPAPKTLYYSMGCMKVSDKLIEKTRDLPQRFDWESTAWNQLDGKVYPGIMEVVKQPHIHEPPLAHVK